MFYKRLFIKAWSVEKAHVLYNDIEEKVWYKWEFFFIFLSKIDKIFSFIDNLFNPI